MDVKFYNVIMLGLAFMFIFTAFQTCGIMEQIVIHSIKSDTPSFKGDGYTSMAIVYAVFAAANWLAPSVISVLGPKYSMVIGSLCYTSFIAVFLYPLTWTLYGASALVGLGAACIWTGQGNFLTINSDTETIARNSGIFWALLQCSLLFGNLFCFLKLHGVESIDQQSRFVIFVVLLTISILGNVMLLFLRKPPMDDENLLAIQAERSIEYTMAENPRRSIVRSFQLLKTREMIFLSGTFFYSGLEMGFFSGVYGTAIGFTRQFGHLAKSLAGLNGIFIGIGEILGGTVFGLLGSRTNKFGRDVIVMLGYITHMVAFYLIYLNLPSDSPIAETSAHAYISSNIYIAMLCSFLLGLGDSCFNTQIYSILGFVFSEDSAPAFALFKFVQSVAAAANFFYSSQILLEWQLLLQVIFGTLGTLSFCFTEWRVTNRRTLGYRSVIGSEHDNFED